MRKLTHIEKTFPHEKGWYYFARDKSPHIEKGFPHEKGWYYFARDISPHIEKGWYCFAYEKAYTY